MPFDSVDLPFPKTTQRYKSFTRGTMIPRRVFKESLLKGTATRLVLTPVLVVLAPIALSLSAGEVPEETRISSFVAPEYPRVARQLMQSGDVVLTLTVDTSGRPKDIVVKAGHVLLGESATSTVSKWRFVPPPSTRNTSVFFHYRFSGTPRDCNPSTIVTVDLQAL